MINAINIIKPEENFRVKKIELKGDDVVTISKIIDSNKKNIVAQMEEENKLRETFKKQH